MKLKILSIFIFIASIAVAQTVSETSGNLTIEFEESLQKIISDKEGAICKDIIIEEEKVIRPEFCNGARVQVFYSKSRTEAEDKLKEAKVLFPNLYSNVVYHAPDYKVYVGYFESRNDASSTLNRAKRSFPASFIYNEKFRCSLINH